jgi:kynureninase
VTAGAFERKALIGHATSLLHNKPVIYFAGNSLGPMPKSARGILEEELDNWAKLGADNVGKADSSGYAGVGPIRRSSVGQTRKR